jgi:hypothetical protein
MHPPVAASTVEKDPAEFTLQFGLRLQQFHPQVLRRCDEGIWRPYGSLVVESERSVRSRPMRGGAMRRILRRLTFANVVSVTALVVALGGTAAASVLITSNSQVAKNTISGHNPPSGDHANIIGGSLATQDLALSAGRTYSRRAAIAAAPSPIPQTILMVPGFGKVQGLCESAGPGEVAAYARFNNTSASPLDVEGDVIRYATANLTYDQVVGVNGSSSYAGVDNTSDLAPGFAEFVIGRGTGSGSRLAHVIVTGLAGDTCVFQAQGTEQVG